MKIIDWYSRFVLHWQLSDTMEIGFVLDAGAKISMDHRGRAYDNIFVERLWRTVKYEDVYPNAYETPREARISINSFMNFYNHDPSPPV